MTKMIVVLSAVIMILWAFFYTYTISGGNELWSTGWFVLPWMIVPLLMWWIGRKK
jgi:hypothetical protein